MNYKISFQERAEIGMKMLAKQKPVTLEQARTQDNDCVKKVHPRKKRK